MKRLTKPVIVPETGETFAYMLESGVTETKVKTKLGKFEDLEEQGRLFILPCEVGDTVYIPKYYLDCEYDYHCPLGYAEGKNMCENGLRCDHEHKKFFIGETQFNIKMLNDIGKTVFLTREEAEAALEKMNGEEHE